MNVCMFSAFVHEHIRTLCDRKATNGTNFVSLLATLLSTICNRLLDILTI